MTHEQLINMMLMTNNCLNNHVLLYNLHRVMYIFITYFFFIYICYLILSYIFCYLFFFFFLGGGGCFFCFEVIMLCKN